MLPRASIVGGAVALAVFFAALGIVNGQNLPSVPPPPASVVQSPTQFRIGEKLTYTFSMDRFRNVAYAETHIVSRGLLNGRDALELRARYKTLDFVSASVMSLDEERIVFVDPATGLPLYVRSIDNSTVLPTESISDLIAAPLQHLDLATLIFRIRHAGGSGVFNIYEKGRVFAVAVQSNGVETVKTEAGVFETTVFSVQSDYFASHGLSDVRINLSNDADRLPVLARIRSARGNLLEAKLASVQLLVPDPPAPVITPVPTPVPIPTPTPLRTPEPYVDNEPLARDIAFVLGERLEYSVIAGARPAGRVVIQARERKQVNGVDSLLLTADVISHDATEQALR
ncbi:MAG: DUF3108 domain-containing protein, partial [Blastocatellia bacterium]|nr:DUF3108 domain-containing protein [Blastocatellia bacterium]